MSLVDFVVPELLKQRQEQAEAATERNRNRVEDQYSYLVWNLVCSDGFKIKRSYKAPTGVVDFLDHIENDEEYRPKLRLTTKIHRNSEERRERKLFRWARKMECIERLGGHCQDCGYNAHLDALEFHHARGVKITNMSVLWDSGTQNEIDEELVKCDLVCANCHTLRTLTRGQK